MYTYPPLLVYAWLSHPHSHIHHRILPWSSIKPLIQPHIARITRISKEQRAKFKPEQPHIPIEGEYPEEALRVMHLFCE